MMGRLMVRRSVALGVSVAVLVVCVPQAASARLVVRRSVHAQTWIGSQLKPKTTARRRAHHAPITTTTTTPPTAPAPTPAPTYSPPGLRWHAGDNQAVCNIGGDPGPWLRSHGANVMRFIVNDREPGQADQTKAPACVRRAEAEGYRVFLSVVLNATWTPSQDAQRVRQVIASYGRVWAVSIGNEEDLTNHAGAMSPARYAAAWNAAEPVLAAADPGALRVYADGSPWSIASNWMPAAWTLGHTGADAIAMNCYQEADGGLEHLAEYAAWAQAQGVPLWCGEGAEVNGYQRTTLARQIAQAPNLEMTASYYWPQVGAFARRAHRR